MKNQLSALLVSVLAFVPCSIQGQGLLNGGFELYNPDTRFLIGWHARGGGGQDYGAIVGGVAGSLIDYSDMTPIPLVPVIAGPTQSLEGFPLGHYWLFGHGPGTTIGQQFLVPGDAGSLQYRALGGVSVQINGVTLEPQVKAYVQPPGPSTSGLADWWVDMRPYAGHEVDLTFYIGQGWGGIDDIRVSTELVPEPGVVALSALGAIGVLAVRKNRSRRL